MTWGACDPDNPKNRRLRCSALIERKGPGGQTAVLVDTSPDFRAQMLSTRLTALDAVLYTHDHADHTHGIDDLRMVAFSMKRRVDVYFDAATGKSLKHRFGYCFETPPGSPYTPMLNGHEIDGATPVAIQGGGGTITAQPIRAMARSHHLARLSRVEPRVLARHQRYPGQVDSAARRS